MSEKVFKNFNRQIQIPVSQYNLIMNNTVQALNINVQTLLCTGCCTRLSCIKIFSLFTVYNMSFVSQCCDSTSIFKMALFIYLSSYQGYKWLQISCLGIQGGAANIFHRRICYCHSFHPHALLFENILSCYITTAPFDCDLCVFIAVGRKV